MEQLFSESQTRDIIQEAVAQALTELNGGYAKPKREFGYAKPKQEYAKPQKKFGYKPKYEAAQKTRKAKDLGTFDGKEVINLVKVGGKRGNAVNFNSIVGGYNYMIGVPNHFMHKIKYGKTYKVTLKNPGVSHTIHIGRQAKVYPSICNK